MSTKILIVEDELIVAEAENNLLSLFGYEVVGVACSAAEALLIAAEKTPDIALLDIKLKGSIDGIQVAELLKKHYEIPIIFLSAYTDEKTLERMKSVEPYSFLVKPFDEKELKVAIEMAVFKQRMSAELTKNEERLRLALEAAGEGFYDYNFSENSVYHSPGWKALRGYPPQTVTDNDFWILHIHPQDREFVKNQFHNHLRGNTTEFECGYRIINKDGEERWLLDKGKVVSRNENGQPLRMLGTNTDVDDRIKAENALRASERQLKITNEDKNHLFTVIAQNLKTPLAGITQVLHLLSDGIILAGEHEELLDELKLSTKNILELLENLFYWAKLERNEIVCRPEAVNLNYLLRETLNLFDTTLQAKNISLKNNIDSEKVIFADLPLLRVVLRNIISNSVKYSLPSGKITVSAHECLQHLTLSVEDNGIGIASAILEKIIAEDGKISTPGTFKEKGAGIGLALSRNFIKLMGGTFHLKSKQDKGTCVIISLPLANI